MNTKLLTADQLVAKIRSLVGATSTLTLSNMALDAAALIESQAARIAELERENKALRNLANNLRPGPISEALAGDMAADYARAGFSPRYEAVECDSLMRILDNTTSTYIGSCGFGYRNPIEQLVQLANQAWQGIKPPGETLEARPHCPSCSCECSHTKKTRNNDGYMQCSGCGLVDWADKGAATPTDDGRCLCGRGKNFHPWRFCDQYQPTIVPNTPGAL